MKTLLTYGVIVLAFLVINPRTPIVWGQSNDSQKNDKKKEDRKGNPPNRSNSGSGNRSNGNANGAARPSSNGSSRPAPANHRNDDDNAISRPNRDVPNRNNTPANHRNDDDDNVISRPNRDLPNRNDVPNRNNSSANHRNDTHDSDVGNGPAKVQEGIQKNPLGHGQSKLGNAGLNEPVKRPSGQDGASHGPVKKNPLEAGNPGKGNPGPGTPGLSGPNKPRNTLPGGGKPGKPGPQDPHHAPVVAGGHHHPGPDGVWDKHEWELAWHRHWYHAHPVWWNNGWYWWDPDVSRYVIWVEGERIPEDVYVVVESPAEPAPPAKRFTGLPIRIVNPHTNDVVLNYTINDYSYEIRPGESQKIEDTNTWVIEFDRGGDFGAARYTLEPGDYYFSITDRGWELYHKSLGESSIPAPPEPGVQ